MNHLTEEQLVLHHYHDDDSPAAVEQHIGACADCRGEYDKLRRVLSLVDELPVPERGTEYGEQVWNRLRWRLGSRRRATWKSFIAIAAVLAVAFFAGQLWHARTANVVGPRPSVVTAAEGGGLASVSDPKPADPQRVLVFVVGDHLESSERVLLEVANADARRDLQVNDEMKRAAELVVSNRMYRQTAVQQGDARIASLLADLEPILLELSHADKLSSEELKSLQKRIDSKGLLFKVRLVSAETSGGGTPAASQKGTDSL
jgi:hypothetical protein